MGKQGAEPRAQAQPGLPCGTCCPPEAISSTCKVGNRDTGMHIYYNTGGISARDLGKSAVTVTFYHMCQLWCRGAATQSQTPMWKQASMSTLCPTST